MDYKDLTALLLKLAGACLLLWCITWVAPTITVMFQPQVTAHQIFLGVTPPLIFLVLSVLLFLFPATVTNKLIRGEKLETNAAFLDSLEVLAIRVIGLFFLVRGSVDLTFHFATIYFIGPFYEAAGMPRPPISWTPELAANIVSTVIELCLAAWFAFGAQGIAGVVNRMRGRRDL